MPNFAFGKEVTLYIHGREFGPQISKRFSAVEQRHCANVRFFHGGNNVTHIFRTYANVAVTHDEQFMFCISGHADKIGHLGIGCSAFGTYDDLDIGIGKLAAQCVDNSQRRVAPGRRAEDELDRGLIILPEKRSEVFFQFRFRKIERLQKCNRRRGTRPFKGRA
jgi:hypothetical protein